MAKTKKSIVKKAVANAKDTTDEETKKTIAHENEEASEDKEEEDEDEDAKGGPGKYKNLGKK